MPPSASDEAPWNCPELVVYMRGMNADAFDELVKRRVKNEPE